MTGTYRKKLIEVALPLEAINKESAREKSIRHGHPSTLHLWWARRPLAACRAVLFSSLVNDPEDDPIYGIDKEIAYTERAKLFDLIEDLVKWENINNPRVINAARLEIARSIAANKVADKQLKDDTPLVANAPKLPEEQTKYLPDPPPEYTAHDIRFKMPGLQPEQVNHFLVHYAPPVLDPFAGGGSIPLEAQRLGLRSYASDLNPVPVLINKALIEIPPKFAGMPPVNPTANKGNLKSKVWNGAEGLAEDVRYYGKWMRDEAEKRIGLLYPKVKVTQEMAVDRSDLESYIGKELTVIAWIWARTVASPNPAFSEAHVPLIQSFWLSKKPGKQVWYAPVVDNESKTYSFAIHSRTPTANEKELIDAGTKAGHGCQFRCLLSGQPIPEEYVKSKGMAGELGSRMIAVVAEGARERVFLSPDKTQLDAFALAAIKSGKIDELDTSIAEDKRALWCLLYGLTTFRSLFNERQLTALLTLSDLARDAAFTIGNDAATSNLKGAAQVEYATAVSTYLAFVVNRVVDRHSTICTWDSSPSKLQLRNTFARQGLPMTWDFAEGNPFSSSSGTWDNSVEWVARVLEMLPASSPSSVVMQDAAALDLSEAPVISTDPPYYDNIGYADLSDFFYVWLRRSIGERYPDLFATLRTPKSQELIASPYRHDGDRDAARNFFETGLKRTLSSFRRGARPGFPVSIFYAFKQAERTTGNNGEQVSSTGWETMLQAVLSGGFSISGTWPMRTEMSNRAIGMGTNALASSIVLVCNPRAVDAPIVTRREFANVLRSELPDAIKHLQSGNVAPVDLAQASIGPGMAVFSRYRQVVNADGSPMSVRESLQMINQMLDESLSEQEADFDSETRFAVRWFDQYGMAEGPFGDAETLAKAMAVAVSGVVEAGILASKAGRVRLLKREELNADWNPRSDQRSTIWECTHHLIRSLETGGEPAAAELLADIQQAKGSEAGEVARELSYRLYSTCERKSRTAEAISYNGLVISWPEISRMARDHKSKQRPSEQRTMFDE